MECKRKDIFITTPIYYVNGSPHIGHAYTTVIADSLARFSRLAGLNTFFLTGTDEHGQKIEQSAKERGKSPKEFADEVSGVFKKLWDDFEISYDKFIRTTDEEHKSAVQYAFKKMLDKGDIYKGHYEGFYCISCETFFKKEELISEQFCPECGKPTNFIREENYFFRLSNYSDRLLAWYEENENCIIPKTKKNEVINFVKEGLADLSITRTSFNWGIKLPFLEDERHIVYVWLDALLNYISALGYGGDEKNMHFWPAKVQIIGKDILRFHAIFWPAFLMSLELPLPKHIAVHGWWTRNGEKMSKSKGNVVDPREVADAYGVEPFRYFLLREVPFGQDGDFSQKALIDRINGDLSNDLGNLLNRTLGMSEKYFGLNISSECPEKQFANELKECDDLLNEAPKLLYEVQTNRYLESIWKVFTVANRAIDYSAPWAKMKEGKEDEVSALLVSICNMLYKCAIMLEPILPNTAKKIADSLGVVIDTEAFTRYVEGRESVKSFTLTKIPPLFPRIEEPLLKSETVPSVQKTEDKKEDETPKIDIDDFFKVDIRVGKIVEAEPLPKSDKLLKLQVDIGEERARQIVAGIKQFVEPGSLVGKKVCVVANLKPAKLMGTMSEGMILAASDEDGLFLVSPLGDVKVGSKVK